jgi:hypothetical protein
MIVRRREILQDQRSRSDEGEGSPANGIYCAMPQQQTVGKVRAALLLPLVSIKSDEKVLYLRSGNPGTWPSFCQGRT